MFSVVIPLYNKAPHIVSTIQSVLAQSHLPNEIIVVDDGSTDGGAEAVKEFSNPLIKFIYQKNAGVSAARNTGAKSAVSSFLVFLDADDSWLPNHLETLVNLIARYPNAGLYSTLYEIHMGQSVLTPQTAYPFGFMGLIDNFFISMAKGLSLVHSSTACIPKNVFLSVGGFPIGLKRGEDLVLWMKLAQCSLVAHAAIITSVYNRNAVNRSVCLREPTPPGSLLYLQDLLAGLNNKSKEAQPVKGLFNQIAFYTAAGMRESGDSDGAKAIRKLSIEMKMYFLASKITILLILSPGILSFARRFRHQAQRSIS